MSKMHDSLILFAALLLITGGKLNAAPGGEDDSNSNQPSQSEGRLAKTWNVAGFLRPGKLPGIQNFVRVLLARDADGRVGLILQTACHTLFNPNTGKSVKLVGVSHLGTMAYWLEMRNEVSHANMVFAEGVNKTKFDMKDACEWIRYYVRETNLTASYLNLVTQDAWRDQVADSRWSGLDIDVRTLNEKLAAVDSRDIKKMAVATNRIEDWLNSPNSSAESRASHIDTLYLQLFSAIPSLNEQSLSNAFVRQRDDVIMKGLRAALSKKEVARISLAYGAAHAWDLEARLLKEDGFKLRGMAWHDALERYFRPGVVSFKGEQNGEGIAVASDGTKRMRMTLPDGTRTITIVSPDGTITVTTMAANGVTTTTTIPPPGAKLTSATKVTTSESR